MPPRHRLATRVRRNRPRIDAENAGIGINQIEGKRRGTVPRTGPVISNPERNPNKMRTSKKNNLIATSTSTSTAAATPAVPAPAGSASPPSPPPAAPAPPDPNAGLAAYVQQTVTSLDAIEVGLGSDPPLTPTQKRHAAKLRKGGESILARIGSLAQQHQLEAPALSVAQMNAALARAQTLQPLASRIAALQRHLGDVMFKAESDAVVIGLTLYALLQRAGSNDAELLTALQPVAAFFAYRHPSTKAPGTPNKRTRKATTKALDTLKKHAPELLQGGATVATAHAGGATPVAAGNGVAAPAAAGGGASSGAASPAGNGAPAPVATGGTTHA